MVKRQNYAMMLLLLCCACKVNATTVSYSLNDLGGGSWQYDYMVDNNSLGHDLFELTVYFDLGKYENLVAFAAPSGWSDLVVQPGSFMGLNDGYYDALTGGGLAAGASDGLFSVQFDWLGAGLPAEQFFEVVDPASLLVLDSGLTSPAVPLPGAAWLFISGVIGLVVVGRSKVNPVIS